MTIKWECSQLEESARLLKLLASDITAEEKNIKDSQNSVNSSTAAINFRSDKLVFALESMCRRGDFLGAIIADENGFPLADFNSPVSVDQMAAYTGVLGDSMIKGRHFLSEEAVNNISMDINYTDKIVLRRFSGQGQHFHLLVICPQDVDERSEMELTVEELQTMIE